MEMDDPRLTERPRPQPKPPRRRWRDAWEPADVFVLVAIVAGTIGWATSPWPWLAGLFVAGVLLFLAREAL